MIDPGLFAESVCKFHAGWLIEDTWNVVGLAVTKVTRFHSSAPLTGYAELIWKRPHSQQLPPYKWEAGGSTCQSLFRFDQQRFLLC